MNHIAITFITPDNQTVAFGYNPDFYESKQHQFEDIIRDLENFKERSEGKKLLISVAFWNDDPKKSNGRLYQTIDELINEFKSKE